jgi:hypothetical protein
VKQNKLKTEVWQEEKVVKIQKLEPLHDIEEVPPPKPPKLVRQINIMPAKMSITPEIMREHGQQMIRERIQSKQNKMTTLFVNSIT